MVATAITDVVAGQKKKKLPPGQVKKLGKELAAKIRAGKLDTKGLALSVPIPDRIENGLPDCQLKIELISQPPNTASANLFSISHLRPRPTGNSQMKALFILCVKSNLARPLSYPGLLMSKNGSKLV